MSITIRRPRDEEWEAICHADGRAFGNSYTPEGKEQRRPLHDFSRWRIAVDDSVRGRGTAHIVGEASSYAFDVTLPGGTTVPMGGVTWVSTATTHRRQGIMRKVIGAIHEDIDERGEPLATLSASEGGIYENVGYGIASRVRVTTIDRRLTNVRREFRTPASSVRHLDHDEDVVEVIKPIWDRYRRTRVGEVSRSDVWHDFMADQFSRAEGPSTVGYYLVHADGYALYRIQNRWNDGQPLHIMHLVELVAETAEAHAALWQTLLDVDLVGEIKSRTIAVDDPLPYLLDNQRALRTTDLNDGIWVNVRDVRVAFGARTYRTVDRIVVEVDGVRWAIEGGPDGGSCKTVRSRSDLVTSHPGLSSLLYGGVQPSELVAGRRMTARNAESLSRADVFFTTSLAPHCQTHY
jgi:predicted acetyltransferase